MGALADSERQVEVRVPERRVGRHNSSRERRGLQELEGVVVREPVRMVWRVASALSLVSCVLEDELRERASFPPKKMRQIVAD